MTREGLELRDEEISGISDGVRVELLSHDDRFTQARFTHQIERARGRCVVMIVFVISGDVGARSGEGIDRHGRAWSTS